MDEIPPASDSKPDPGGLSIAWQFFGSIPDRFKEILAPAFDRVQLAPNERLIRQGEHGDLLYIVLKGQLQVIYEEPDGSDKFLAFIGPGEGVGEISYLTGERRTATVDAVRASEQLSLSRKCLEAAQPMGKYSRFSDNRRSDDALDLDCVWTDGRCHRTHRWFLPGTTCARFWFAGFKRGSGAG
mgnify:CR=1 FL=1